MNSISNETLERLELYKKVSGEVVNKIENNMTYVETLLIYEIMNSNFFNKDKMFFNYKLFSRLAIKKYSRLYEKELTAIRSDLIDSLNNDLKYNVDPAVKENIRDMITLLDKPVEDKFEEKCQVMIENFEESLAEIIESNAALMRLSESSENAQLEGKSALDSVSDLEKLSKEEVAKKAAEEQAIKEAKEQLQKEEDSIIEAKDFFKEDIIEGTHEIQDSLKYAEELVDDEELEIIEEDELISDELSKEAEEFLEDEHKEEVNFENLKAPEDELSKEAEEVLENFDVEGRAKEIEEENKDIESMLGAIDTIYNEMGNADLDQIDYTTFLNYIEEDEIDSLDVDSIIKNEKSIEINEDLSKTLDDLDLGTDSSLEYISDLDDSTLDSIDTSLEEEDKDVAQRKNLSNINIETNLDEIDPSFDMNFNNDIQAEETLEEAVEEQEESVPLEEQSEEFTLDDLEINVNPVSEEESSDLEVAKNLESITSDLNEEYSLNTTTDLKEETDSAEEDLKLDDLDSNDLLGDVDDIDDLLNGIDSLEKDEEDEEDENSVPKEKSSKFGRIKFGFRKK